MQTDGLNSYEEWQPSNSQISEPSRLYALEPMGVGTPYIESITSYVSRLAEAHSVPTGLLILSEIAPLMNTSYIFDGKSGGLDKIFANQTKSLNGVGNWSKNLVHAIESLTPKKNLHLLTMQPWAEVIPSKGVLKSRRSWCPSCYSDWRKSESRCYEPLIWLLNPITICPHHYEPLQMECPHCNQINLVLSWSSRPGYCSKCHNWLGTDQTENLGKDRLLSADELIWQDWVSGNLGELLSISTPIRYTFRERISEILTEYVDSLTDGNVAAFAQIIGMGRVQTHRWCVGKTSPSLDILLQICFSLEISLLNFFSNRVTIEQLNKLRAKVSRKKKKEAKEARGGGKKLNEKGEILRALEAALLESPPPSLAEVATRLGYRKSSALYYHSAELCQLIAQRDSNHRKTKSLNDLKRILEEALERDEEPPFSMRQVAAQSGTSVQTLYSHFPSLCKAISSQHDNYLSKRKDKRVQEVNQEIQKIVSELTLKGIEPTASRVSERMTKPRVILQETAIHELKRLRSELGLEN